MGNINILSLADDPQLMLVFFVIFICCFVPIFILVIITFIKFFAKQRRKMKKKTSNALYLSYFGPSENIISVSKNLSRVTVEVADIDLVNLEGLKEEGIGVLVSGNIIKCSSQAFADQIENKD